MFIKTHASLRNFSPSKFVAVIARLSETERELVVEIMHPASFIETMCLKTQLVAAHLYLKASLDAEMEYYEKGLVREDDVLDAQVEYELFEYDKMIACLEGLSLYYDILIYSL